MCWVGQEVVDSQWERHRGVASHVDDPWGSREAHVTAHLSLAISPFQREKGKSQPGSQPTQPTLKCLSG